MSYTLPNAYEDGNYEAKECYLCDRVATKKVKVEGKTYEVCRTCTAKDVAEDLNQ